MVKLNFRGYTHCLVLICILSATIHSKVYSQSSGGSLVIVGGGLEANNESIYRQMIDLAGGTEKAQFAVIPSASGVAAQSWVSFSKILMTYGLKADQIHLINIAMIDDDSTTDVDESKWKDNGSDTKLAEIIRRSSAVWFTGGDQLRTMKTLVNPDGTETPVLKAVREVYRNGGVIGGSSAGAAIMSEVMIGNGSSFGALTLPISTDINDEAEKGSLLITTGLGFFPYGIVDQHFHAKGRLARLAVALNSKYSKSNIAFGVDENTAIIYNSVKKSFKVAGTGGVTILEDNDTEVSMASGGLALKNVVLSYLEEGDVFDLEKKIIIPAAGKKPLKGKEYYDHETFVQTGILNGESPSFRDLITNELINNKAAGSIDNLNISNQTAYMIRFSKTPLSEGFEAEITPDYSSFTVLKVLLDIYPVTLLLQPNQ
jgi:cyanophycinase